MKLKNIKYILFDLDGTITDPYEGITKSVVYSLEKFGIKVEDRRQLIPFIGPPLFNSYMKYYSMNEEEAERAVAYYREYYPTNGIYDSTLYDGAREMLYRLSQRYKLVLATSKPQPFAEKILQNFDLTKFFFGIVGATFDKSVSEKSDVIKKVLCDYSILPEEAIMVGDRNYDTEGAAANGVSSVGVTYGYGKREEFLSASAVADSIEDLSRILGI